MARRAATIFCLLAAIAPAAFAAPTIQQILNNPSLLKDNCKLVDTHQSALEGNAWLVELYACPVGPDIQQGIIRVQFQQRERLLPGGLPFKWPAGYEPQSGYAPDPVLLVNNGNGGNAWNANQYYVLSLAEDTPLKLLGRVSGREQQDKNLTLMVADDIWELGLGILCHACSPSATIFLKIQNGRILRDLPRTRAEAEKKIEELGALIEQLKPKVLEVMPADDTARGLYLTQSGELLSAMLSRFLWYRDIGKQRKGWKILQQDLRFYNPQVFPVSHTVTKNGKAVNANTFPIADLEARIEQSLKENPLDKWLEKTTAASVEVDAASTPR